MPLYEYQCFVCDYRFERLQKVNDKIITDCPSCGGRVRRLLGAPALQFKGSGWYVTDYGKGNGNGKSRTGESTSDTSKGTSESTSKTETTSSSSTSSSASKPSDSGSTTSKAS